MYFHISPPYALPKQQELLNTFKLLVLQPFPCTFSPLVLDVGSMFRPLFVMKFSKYSLQMHPLHISFPRNEMQMTVCSLCEVWDSGFQQATEHNSGPKFCTHISFVRFPSRLEPHALVLVCVQGVSSASACPPQTSTWPLHTQAGSCTFWRLPNGSSGSYWISFFFPDVLIMLHLKICRQSTVFKMVCSLPFLEWFPLECVSVLDNSTMGKVLFNRPLSHKNERSWLANKVNFIIKTLAENNIEWFCQGDGLLFVQLWIDLVQW